MCAFCTRCAVISFSEQSVLHVLSPHVISNASRELEQQRRQRHRKHHLKINIWKMVTILWLLLLPRTIMVDREWCKWTGRSAVEASIENETFTVVCSRCR